MKDSIGLLGGSFNPPHSAHIALALAAKTQLHLSRVDLMPAGQPWQKAGHTMALPEHRLAMCQLAVQGQEGIGVEPCEVLRLGKTYTIDTLRSLTTANPHTKYVFIMGADQAQHFDTWHDWQGIVSLCTLALAHRAGQVPSFPAVVQTYLAQHQLQVLHIDLPVLHISASQLRQAIFQGNMPLEHLPKGVAGYIAKHSLYIEQLTD